MGSQWHDVQVFDVFTVISAHPTAAATVQVGVELHICAFILASAGVKPDYADILKQRQDKLVTEGPSSPQDNHDLLLSQNVPYN